MIVVAIAAGLIGYVIGKPNQAQEEASKPTEPTEPEKPPVPPGPKEGLVAYYPFNGNAKDESGNSNDGEVKGATLTSDRHGNDNEAFDFSVPRSHIQILESDTLKPQKMTLNAWVYISKEGIDEPWEIFANAASIQWVIDNTGKMGAKNFFGFKQPGAGIWVNVSYQGKIPAGEWFMYTATYDGASLKQHLNTKEICSLPFAGTVPYGLVLGKSLWIGGSSWREVSAVPEASRQAKKDVTCKLDDLRIYNRALSEEEIKALYDLEKPKE